MITTKLLIEYDEHAQEIRFFEMSGDSPPSLAIRVPVAVYTDGGAELAERRMGETVFTFFDRWSKTKIGLRNYVEEARAAHAAGRTDVAHKAHVDDASAQFHLAIDRFTEGVKDKSAVAIGEAESWLRRAAANGSKEAVEYLSKHWERDKAFALRTISDK